MKIISITSESTFLSQPWKTKRIQVSKKIPPTQAYQKRTSDIGILVFLIYPTTTRKTTVSFCFKALIWHWSFISLNTFFGIKFDITYFTFYFKRPFDIALSFMTIIISFVSAAVDFAYVSSHLGCKCDTLNKFWFIWVQSSSLH